MGSSHLSRCYVAKVVEELKVSVIPGKSVCHDSDTLTSLFFFKAIDKSLMTWRFLCIPSKACGLQSTLQDQMSSKPLQTELKTFASTDRNVAGRGSFQHTRSEVSQRCKFT